MESTTIIQPLGHLFSLEVASRHAAWYGELGYERLSARLFAAGARWADTVVDIGAHIGFYTVLAGVTNPTAQIVAVEASPGTSEVLSRNIAANSVAARSINAVFTDTAGTVVLEITEASDNCSLVGHPDSPTIDRATVSAITAEGLGIESPGRLLVKMDVEGHEVAALSGLESLVEQAEEVRLLVEFNPRCLARADADPGSILRALERWGLALFALDDNLGTWARLRPGTDPAEVCGPEAYVNLYAVKASTAMSVMAFVHSGALAGAERRHLELTNTLLDAGVPVHTVVPSLDGGLASRLRADGSSVSTAPMPWWAAPTEVAAIPTLTGVVECTSELSRVNPHVSITQTIAIPQGALAARSLGIPHIWCVHEFGDLDHDLVLPAPPTMLGDALSDLSDFVVVNSRAVARHFFDASEDALVISADPILGAPPDQFGAERMPRTHSLTVAVVGAVKAGKGQSEAIEAVGRLRARGVEVELRIIGGGTPHELELLQVLVGELDVVDSVIFVGEVDDIFSELGQVNVVVVPSRMEAFGRVPFEATWAGIPVVYAESGGLLDYMIDGKTGLAYPPGDSEALAHQLERLCDDGLRRDLVSNARRTLGDPQRLTQQGDQFWEVLRKAAATSQPGSEPPTWLVDWILQGAINSIASAEELLTAGRLAVETERRAALDRIAILERRLRSHSERARQERDRLALMVLELEQKASGQIPGQGPWRQREQHLADDAALREALARQKSAEELVAALLSSTSWRITAPVRWLRRGRRV